LRAQQVWRTLPELIEERWQGRLAADEISGLRDSLQAEAASSTPGCRAISWRAGLRRCCLAG